LVDRRKAAAERQLGASKLRVMTYDLRVRAADPVRGNRIDENSGEMTGRRLFLIIRRAYL
jgi:hypothetical protein